MAEVFLVMTIVAAIAALILIIGVIANVCDAFFDTHFTNRFSDLMDGLGELAIVTSIAIAGFAGLISVVNHMFF